MKTEITVIVMTYNQKEYISKALDSILSQNIDIGYSILIHDDCSNDGTYEILLDYQTKYPNKIQIIHQETRKFLVDGFNMMIYKYVVPHIETKYVAYCDGDDFWCDDFKLQKQYDFMEKHKDYSMCFHSAYQLKNDEDMSSKWFISKEKDIDMTDLINDKPGICVATSSIFLRKEVFVDFPDWRKAFPVEDVPMYIMAAIYGKIHCLSDVMCVYRQFASGSWTSQNKNNLDRKAKHLNGIKEAIIIFDEWSQRKYSDLVTLQINSCDFRIALLTKNYNVIFNKTYKHLLKRMTFKERISLKLQYRLPCLYNLLHKKKKD